MKNDVWTAAEVEAIVLDYFRMLHAELHGVSYVKAHHRRALKPLLNGRSDGAIEMKYCNISAVLAQLGMPYIAGYKPRKNLQDLLREKVTEQVRLSRFVLPLPRRDRA